MRRHCTRGIITRGHVFLEALVAPPGWLKSGGLEHPGVMPMPVEVLFDTGATYSCITPALAEAFKLWSVGSNMVISADMKSLKKVYQVDIRVLLPQRDGQAGVVPSRDFHKVRVMEAYGEINQIILGMDIITQGSFAIDGQKFRVCL